MSKTYGVDCIYFPCEIRNEREIDEMITISKKLGGVDILVNIAGKIFFGDVVNLSLEDFNDCIKINFTAPFLF